MNVELPFVVPPLRFRLVPVASAHSLLSLSGLRSTDMLMSKRKREVDDVDLGKRVIQPPTPALAEGESQTLGNNTAEEVLSASQSDSLAKLKSLIDLTGLTEQKDIEARFDLISVQLLNHVVLRLNAPQPSHNDTAPDMGVTVFEILELEFYLYKSGCHEDPFTHGAEEQRQSGRWCVAKLR